MTTYLKAARPAEQDREHQAGVRETVSSVIADVRERGDAAVREYSEKFDGWSPANFRLEAEEIEKIVASVPEQVIADIRDVQQRVRGFAQHQLASLRDFEVETEPGVLLGQKQHPGGLRGRLRARRTLPAGGLGAHDRGDGEGGRGRARHRLHAADPRRGPRGDRRRHASGRRRRDPAARRHAGGRGDGRRHRDHRQGGPAGRPGQRLRRRGEAPAVRRGRHRPVRRPHRDPRRSPTSRPTRSWWPSTCSARPSTDPTRPRC